MQLHGKIIVLCMVLIFIHSITADIPDEVMTEVAPGDFTMNFDIISWEGAVILLYPL